MNILIAYKTKWGSTKQYAEWLAEEFPGSQLANLDTVTPEQLQNFDLIIIGSLTYKNEIMAGDFLVKNWDILQTKLVYLFSVGQVLWNKPDSQIAYAKIPEQIRKGIIGHTKLPGRIDVAKLTPEEKAHAEEKQLDFSDNVTRSALQSVISALAIYRMINS